jgi:glycogen debranching enzyme
VPTFEAIKDQLPEPVLDSHPDWVRMYWRCWEIGFKNIQRPPAASLLVSTYIDAAFGKVTGYTYQWDSCFMMMFARYGHFQFPLIHSLDNFYARQLPSGFICREIDGKARIATYGHNGGYKDPAGWKNTINPPLFAWAECESYKVTGDKSRFELVLPVLEKYVEFLNRDGDPDADPKDWEAQGRRSVGTPHLLYWNTDLGSGMDDTPKPAKKGAGWVDMSCQMVMQYRELALMCRELGLSAKAEVYDAEAKVIADRINKWCWNNEDGFYYDVLADGTQFKKKTACGFWPMLAGITSPEQVSRLVAHLRSEKEFWRVNVFPTLAADEKGYQNPSGWYWRGAVWAPTNYEIIKGLQACGEEAFATEATKKYLAGMAEVFKTTNTVFENYMPERLEPAGKRGDFVGWTGLGPISLLIENVLGFRADGAHNRLEWHLARNDPHGIRRLRFGAITTDVLYDGKETVNVTSNAPFTLVINGVPHEIGTGESKLKALPNFTPPKTSE